jgi:hypothetical protein
MRRPLLVNVPQAPPDRWLSGSAFHGRLALHRSLVGNHVVHSDLVGSLNTNLMLDKMLGSVMARNFGISWVFLNNMLATKIQFRGHKNAAFSSAKHPRQRPSCSDKVVGACVVHIISRPLFLKVNHAHAGHDTRGTDLMQDKRRDTRSNTDAWKSLTSERKRVAHRATQ